MRQDDCCSVGFAKTFGLLLIIAFALAIAVVRVMWPRSAPGAAESSEQSTPLVTTPAGKADMGFPEQQTVDTALQESKSARNWSALINTGTDAAARGRDDAREFVLQLFTALDRLLPADRLETVCVRSGGGRGHRRLVARAWPQRCDARRRAPAIVLRPNKDSFFDIEAQRLSELWVGTLLDRMETGWRNGAVSGPTLG